MRRAVLLAVLVLLVAGCARDGVRGFYMGGEVPDDAYDFWVEKMNALYDSESWQTAATESGLTPIWRGGEEFNTFVRESEKKAAEISKAIGVIN